MNDPYAAAEALADSLRAAGLVSSAQQIEDKIAGGATATEILMGVRWAVQKLLTTETLNLPLESMARELVSDIDLLLA